MRLSEVAPAAKAQMDKIERENAAISAQRVKEGCDMMFSWRDWAARLNPMPSNYGDIFEYAGPSYATYDSACLAINDERVRRVRARQPYMLALKTAVVAGACYFLYKTLRESAPI